MELSLFNVQISSLICHGSRLCGSVCHGWEEMTPALPQPRLLAEKAGDASIRHTFLWAPPHTPVALELRPFHGGSSLMEWRPTFFARQALLGPTQQKDSQTK